MSPILVIDDNPDHRRLVREVLTPRGYQVLEAGDGDQALAQVRESRPALIFLDMKLPRRHGLEVLRQIRELPEGAAAVVVALSAQSQPPEQRQALAAGCAAFLTKPVSLTDLYETAARHAGYCTQKDGAS